jgi:hypothetical protein
MTRPAINQVTEVSAIQSFDYLLIQLLKPLVPNILFQFAFPDDKHIPSVIFDNSIVFFITFLVLFKFRHPVVFIGFWKNEIRAALMAMPEATINENHGFVFWQNNVRASRISSVIFSIPKSI